MRYMKTLNKNYKRALRRVACLALMLALSLPAVAQWTVDKLPMVHLQDARRYVCNPDGVLSQEAVQAIDARLMALEKQTGVQTVVVVVKSLDPDDPFEFGIDLSKKYGIGLKGKDTGLIVILATEDRSYQILTGEGLEGTLPDALVNRIQDQVMVPKLKDGEWDAAMVSTIEALDGVIRQDAELIEQYELEEEEMTWGEILLIIVILAGIIAFLWYICWRSSKCPKCGQHSYGYVGEKRVVLDGKRKIVKTYRCKKCGYEHNETEDDPDSGGGGGGALATSMLLWGVGRALGGGGRSGGGGSFGGGSFGGGGSGGRF